MITIKVNKTELPNAPSPGFAYCRKLIKEGQDPDSRLEIYGKHIYFDYAIPNIGIGAGLTIKEEPTLHIVKYKFKEL